MEQDKFALHSSGFTLISTSSSYYSNKSTYKVTYTKYTPKSYDFVLTKGFKKEKVH